MAAMAIRNDSLTAGVGSASLTIQVEEARVRTRAQPEPRRSSVEEREPCSERGRGDWLYS